jgi:hypothetical protein
MQAWFAAGYFNMDLQVRRSCDTDFSSLGMSNGFIVCQLPTPTYNLLVSECTMCVEDLIQKYHDIPFVVSHHHNNDEQETYQVSVLIRVE